MLPATRLRQGRKVWSKSCVELAVLGTGELEGYKVQVPRPAETCDRERRRASADSLESGYGTFSLSDCDLEPAASPAHSAPRGGPKHPSCPVTNTSPVAKSTKKRKSLRRSFGRTYSMRNKTQERRHSTATRQSSRLSFGRSFSVRSDTSSPRRRDTVVHPKAKVTELVPCNNTLFQEACVMKLKRCYFGAFCICLNITYVSLPSPHPPHLHHHLQCKLELKPLEPAYRSVRVVIPHLECEMTVEYDQFSTVFDVLHQVLSMASPPLNAAQGYSLYHVRLRAK